jgi:predicted nucleotidyltransferase
MRLAAEQIAAIRQSALEVFGEGTRMWLFGSRADDSKRGGDIDLLIVPPPLGAQERLLRKIRLLTQLERRLGERKVDIVVETEGDDRPIVRTAHETGIACNDSDTGTGRAGARTGALQPARSGTHRRPGRSGAMRAGGG